MGVHFNCQGKVAITLVDLPIMRNFLIPNPKTNGKCHPRKRRVFKKTRYHHEGTSKNPHTKPGR